jgi:acetate---CoA ligase (ADP-forming)
MMSSDLTRFFSPSAAAVVGATNDRTKFGGRCFAASAAFSNAVIYPVNPTADQVAGQVCYPTLKDLPQRPDHVGIAVPAGRVMDVLADCAACGVPFVTLYTAGFGEIGTESGLARQAEIVDYAFRHGIRLMGPNCNGTISFAHRFALSPTASVFPALGLPTGAGRIGVIAQSGGLGQISVMLRAMELGLGISHQVSCGNQADIDVLDFADYMIADPHTDVILMAAESIPDGAKLRDVAARALEREKPIVILKFGRTEAGRRQSASHTGAVTGSAAVHSAAFRQFGMIEVDDCHELYQVAMLLRQRRWPKSNGAATVAVSGGHSVLLADLGSVHSIEWPPYGPSTQERLSRLIPDFGRVDNPTDLTASAIGSGDAFTRSLDAIADDDNIDIVLPIYSVQSRAEIRAGADFVHRTAKTAALLWTGGCSDAPDLTPRSLVEEGVPVFREATACLKAARAAVNFGAAFSRAKQRRVGGGLLRPPDLNVTRARALLASASAPVLTERESRAVLAAYGFPVMREALATSAEEAMAIAADLQARVALKIESPDIAHKSEAGGLRLGLRQPDAIAAAYGDIIAAARSYAPNAVINGVLVQEMAPAGIELIVGLSRDRTFGPVVSVGIGGIHVEVLRDISHRLAPIETDEAKAMLGELRGYPILAGVRGMPPRDVEAIADLLVRLSWLAHDLRDVVEELDVNPLVVLEKGAGACVVDALIARRA